MFSISREDEDWPSCLVLARLAALPTFATLTGRHRGRAHDTSGSGGLADKRLVDMGDNTTTGDGGLDKGVKLLITTDGEKQMTGGDTLHLKIFTGVTGKLKNLGGQVLHDGGSVHGGGSTNTLLGVNTGLEESVDTTDGEL